MHALARGPGRNAVVMTHTVMTRMVAMAGGGMAHGCHAATGGAWMQPPTIPASAYATTSTVCGADATGATSRPPPTASATAAAKGGAPRPAGATTPSVHGAIPTPAVPGAPAATPGGGESRALYGQTFEVRKITAMRRSVTGSKLAQWARHNALIPGVVYGFDKDGRDETVLVYVREADLRREVNKRGECFLNTLYDIEVDGAVTRVLPRDFQVHPFRPKAIAINWLRYRPGAYPGARIDIPLKPLNEERCHAFKEGGWLFELRDKLPVYAHGDEIPDYLYMDLRNKRVGDKIMASHIDLNDGLTLRSKVRDFAVAKFLGSRRGEEEASTSAEGAPAASAKASTPATAGSAKASGDGASKPTPGDAAKGGAKPTADKK